MERDIRQTDLYQEAEALYRKLRQPRTGLISDAAEVSTNGTHAAFTGTIVDKLEGTPPTRICLATLADGDTRVLTFGPNTDRLPRFSPDGKRIAFLSDRAKTGDFQLYLLDPKTGAAEPAPKVDGWVEYFHWSPDGKKILMGVAGHGADVAGGQGAVTSKQVEEDLPSWMPLVETGDEEFRWRHAWVHEFGSGKVRQVGPKTLNIWETVWCGNDAIAAVVSPGPGERLWYSARVNVIDLATGKAREVFEPKDQLGWPGASPSGKKLAVVEAVCSDRWIVAGELRLIDTATKKVKEVDTNGIDVTYTEWRSEKQLLIAGHRAFETVVALYDAGTGKVEDIWASDELTIGGRYVQVSGMGDEGDCVLITESFAQAPQIALIRKGKHSAVKSFDVGNGAVGNVVGSTDKAKWKAKDGLEIHGFVVRPKWGKGPYPLVMHVHGGPVWHWRPSWLGRGGFVPLLLKHGYAVFYPNPRGSSGRGTEFIRHVVGDMNGADTFDYLAGLDQLVKQGVADPKRIGVMGGSYGGMMTSWLITQDERFAAAVPMSPVTNQVTEHLIGNIPHFQVIFLNDRYDNPTGRYFTRSAIMYANRVKTPTLNICGALDRCTPPEEAVQFHNALLENGVTSVLVKYPEEGHGVRKLPTIFDHATRIVSWFEEHMPARSSRRASAERKVGAHA